MKWIKNAWNMEYQALVEAGEFSPKWARRIMILLAVVTGTTIATLLGCVVFALTQIY